MHALGLEFGSAARLSKRPGSVWNCLWGHALKRSPGIIRILVLDFYLVLHGLRCRKSTLMDLTKLTMIHHDLCQAHTARIFVGYWSDETSG